MTPTSPPSSSRTPVPQRVTAWFARWGPILPLLAAELIVWLGFGALLPVMPLYFTEHGVSLEVLGFVIAAWPIARLVGEPVFGWIADRTPRVPLMVGGLVATAIAVGLSLVFTGPAAFLVLRFAAGLATAAYDPAARGFLTDSTPPERRGEAFGLYGAAQMAGLLLGPAIGGLGAAAFGGIGFVFAFCAVATLAAAVAVALRVHESDQTGRGHVAFGHDLSEFPPESASAHRRAADDLLADGRVDDAAAEGRPSRLPVPSTLLNRLLLTAIILNLGGYFAGGTYEVVWSLFLEERGAGLDLIGLTFAMFALPVLFVSPLAGRYVDRHGVILFVVLGSLATAGASALYPFVPSPVLVIPILFVEATGFAILNPALYAIVAAASPRGKSSTAQGIFGAAGTVGTIVASIATGFLAEMDLRFPFWLCSVVMSICLVIGLLVGGRLVRGMTPAIHGTAPSPAA
jgi:MFS transporter, DHA1 family, multidrug resistance protein